MLAPGLKICFVRNYVIYLPYNSERKIRMKELASKDERIEIRLSAEDKELFQRVQKISNDKSFSSFVIRIVKDYAQSFIAEHERILASEKDRQIFFDAVFGNIEPIENLKEAGKRYTSAIEKR